MSDHTLKHALSQTTKTGPLAGLPVAMAFVPLNEFADVERIEKTTDTKGLKALELQQTWLKSDRVSHLECVNNTSSSVMRTHYVSSQAGLDSRYHDCEHGRRHSCAWKRLFYKNNQTLGTVYIEASGRAVEHCILHLII